MRGCGSGACPAIEAQFGSRRAQRDLAAYRKKGPGPTTRLLRDAVVASGGPGETLLDVGAGIGPLTFELLERGARRAVSVEASAAAIAAGRDEAERRGRAADIEWHHGDFVSLAGSVGPSSTVVLDRVVCCYPSFVPLLDAAALRARQRIGIAYPRDVWYVRLALLLDNGLRALKGEAFRTFVHPPREIERLIRAHGFLPAIRRRTPAWCVDVYTRTGASA
jgi:SAM-dependent methyltransferase